jgi:hypothetical protein
VTSRGTNGSRRWKWKKRAPSEESPRFLSISMRLDQIGAPFCCVTGVQPT